MTDIELHGPKTTINSSWTVVLICIAFKQLGCLFIYRVSHIETWDPKWAFEFHQSVFKKVILADLNTLRQRRC